MGRLGLEMWLRFENLRSIGGGKRERNNNMRE
jgi:hypothetical protein